MGISRNSNLQHLAIRAASIDADFVVLVTSQTVFGTFFEPYLGIRHPQEGPPQSKRGMQAAYTSLPAARRMLCT